MVIPTKSKCIDSIFKTLSENFTQDIHGSYNVNNVVLCGNHFNYFYNSSNTLYDIENVKKNNLYTFSVQIAVKYYSLHIYFLYVPIVIFS